MLTPHQISELLNDPGIARLDGGARLDATATAFLAHELEQHRTVEFDVQYPASRTLTFLPLATDVDALAKTFSWNIWNETGRAKVVSGDSGDIPRVAVSKSEETGRLHWLATSFGYSVLDMRRAARFGIPLDTRLQRAAARAIDRSIDEILRTGTLASVGQTLGLVGFLNASAVDAAPGTMHNWLDDDTTAQDIVDDLETVVNAVAVRTYDIYRPDTLLMSSILYRAAVSKRFAGDASMTAMRAFLEQHPEIRTVDSWVNLNGAGAGSKHRAVAYLKNPEVIEAVCPVRYEQLPMQLSGLEMSTVCFGACGGVQIHQPAAMQYADFANAPSG